MRGKNKSEVIIPKGDMEPELNFCGSPSSMSRVVKESIKFSGAPSCVNLIIWDQYLHISYLL